MKFTLFVLGATLMLGAIAPVWAQQANAPQIAALLPPARTVGGLQLQITDARFGTVAGEGRFTIACKVTAPDAKLSDEKLNSLVTLNSLFAPDGTPLMSTAYDGKRIYSSEVSPLWKSVRAEFEVRDLSSPDAVTGREVTHREFKVDTLPALPAEDDEETAIESKIKLVTARGSQLQLVNLTRKKRGDRSVLVAHWKFTPPADAPDAEADIENATAIFLGADGERMNNFGLVGGISAYVFQGRGVGEIDVQWLNVPNDVQSINCSLDVIESARQWRADDAFSLVSFDVPVAALWKIAPLAPSAPAVSAVKARDADVEASWEMHGPDYADQPQVRLWLRDLAPDKSGEKWTLKGATVPENDGQTRDLFGATQGWNSLFHTDNSLASADETSVAFSMYRPENLGATADFTLTVQRARTILSAHILPLVPLPKRNDVVEFGPQEVFDGLWHLRRIAWIDDERLAGDLRFSGGAALLLTFDIGPNSYLGQDDMQLKRDVFYDEKGAIRNSSSTFMEGDPAEPGHEKDRITMILSPPDASSRKFGGNFQIFQRVWSGPTKTLVLPDVPLRSPDEKTP